MLQHAPLFFVYRTMRKPLAIRHTIVCYFLLACGYLASAQDMVVSEYLNFPGPSAAKEWTEIVVVKDNLNVVGWTIHDHSDFDPRQGPVFQDIPLFQHLRAGTIIVIDHRKDVPPQQLDTTADDGFLLITQLDSRFFSLGGNGIDVSQPGELIIIRDQDGNAVHALGHFNSKTLIPSQYTDLTCPKTAYDAPSQLSNNHSNRVTGRTIAAYCAGIGTDSTSYGPQITTAPPEDPGTGPSKGLPNLIDNPKRLAKLKNTNQLFWRELREPKWSAAPTVTVDASNPTMNRLTWTPLTDDYPSDRTTGYIILRDTNNFAAATFPDIHDGTNYKVSDAIGSATVVAIQNTADGTEFADKDAPCGTTFVYRVYGFRYGADLFMSQTADTTARGRQYTERSFAQSKKVSKPKPPTPTIYATRTVICQGDTTTLWTTATTNIETYTWLRNGVPLEIGFTVSGQVKQPGTYQLVVTAPGGCKEVSNTIEILPLPAPTVTISPLGVQTICAGDTVILTVHTPAPEYELLNNGLVVRTQKSPRFALTTSGTYAVRIKTGTLCDGVSETVVVKIPDVRFHFEPGAVHFGKLGGCETSKQSTVDIVNDGTEKLILAAISMPTGFALVSPSPGFTLESGKRLSITLLFSPSVAGVTSGNATFVATPCDVPVTVTLTGEQTQTSASLDKADVDFGVYTTCPGTVVNDSMSFEITNSGSSQIVVTPPIVTPPFYTTFSSKTLLPGSSVPITIRYIPLGADLNRSVTQSIAFPFTGTPCSDTLRATLRAASYHPVVSVPSDTINVGSFLGCTGTLDGAVAIVNSGAIPFTVSSAVGANTTYSGLPITVPPGQTRSVQFVYSLSGAPGMYSEIDTLYTAPCNGKIPVTIQGSLQQPTYALSEGQVTFDTVLLCEPDPTRYDTVTLTQQWPLGGAQIRSATIASPFGASLLPGTPIVDSILIPISFEPVASGTFTDTLLIELEPCGTMVKLPVIGVALHASRSTIINNADFGTLGAGTSSDRRLVVENTGDTPILLNKLVNVVIPWSVVTELPALPTLLQPADSAVVILRYTYSGADRADTLLIASTSSSGNCSDSIPMVLTGATESAPDTLEKITGVTLVLPSNLTFKPGDVATIPVALLSDQPLIGKGLTAFSSTILYNPTVLKITGVAARSNSVASASVVEVSPGVAEMQVLSATELTEAEPIVDLQGTVYLGNARQTMLDIDTVESPQAEIEAQDGSLQVVGDCAINTQIVELGEPPSIVVGERGLGAQTVNLTTLTNQETHLVVTAVSGITVLDVTTTLRPGRHTLHIDTSAWPTGWYGIMMQHGIFIGSASFVITR